MYQLCSQPRIMIIECVLLFFNCSEKSNLNYKYKIKVNFLSVLSLCPTSRGQWGFQYTDWGGAQIPDVRKQHWPVDKSAKWCEYIWGPWRIVNAPCWIKFKPKWYLIWELVNIAYNNPTWTQNLNAPLPPASSEDEKTWVLLHPIWSVSSQVSSPSGATSRETPTRYKNEGSIDWEKPTPFPSFNQS